MRATLTDDGCTYTGGTSLPPVPTTVEVENRSSRFAAFWLYELASGVTPARVERAFRELRTGEVAELPRLFDRSIWRVTTDPGERGELSLNETSGRYVVLCVEPKVDTHRSPEAPIYPDHVYVPAELVVAK